MRPFFFGLALLAAEVLGAQSVEFQSLVSVTTDRDTAAAKAETLYLVTENAGIVSDRRTLLPSLDAVVDFGWGWKTDQDGQRSPGLEKAAFHGQLNQAYVEWELGDSLWVSAGKKRYSTSVLFFRSFADLLARHSPFALDPNLPSLEPLQHFQEGHWTLESEWDIGDLHGQFAFLPSTAALPGDSGFFRFNLESPDNSGYLTVSGRFGDLDVKLLYLQPLGDSSGPAHWASTAEWVATDSLALKAETAISSRMKSVKVVNTAGQYDAFDKTWVPQGGLGLTLTTPSDHSFLIEYDFNGAGFEGVEYDDLLKTARNNPGILRDQGLLLAARHYLFTQQDWALSGKVRFRIQSLTNLQDRSGFWGLKVIVPMDDWEVEATAHTLFGETDSEGGLLPRSVTAGLLARVKLAGL